MSMLAACRGESARVGSAWWLAVLLCVMPGPGYAAGITVGQVSTALVDKVYRLNAEIDYDLSEELLDALHNGVVIPFELEIRLVRPRGYIWDEEIAVLHQRYDIQHHALTGQYIVTHLNSGAQESFASLHQALARLGTVKGLPLVDAQLLTPGSEHRVQLQAYVSVESLPVPLRLLAYVYRGWRLSSEWHELPLLITPGGVRQADRGD